MRIDQPLGMLITEIQSQPGLEWPLFRETVRRLFGQMSMTDIDAEGLFNFFRDLGIMKKEVHPNDDVGHHVFLTDYFIENIWPTFRKGVDPQLK